MSAATDAMIGAAKAQALVQAQALVANGRSSLLEQLASFVQKEDLVELESLFDKAVAAKAGQFTASTNEQAQEFADEYESYMETAETIGDRYVIVGKAKAGVWIRHMMHQVISGFFAVAGAVLQVGLGIAVPVAGTFAGAALNQGLQHVVAYFNEEA